MVGSIWTRGHALMRAPVLALVATLALGATAVANPPRLCLLGVPAAPQHRTHYAGFFQGLRDFGYEEGRTLTVDYRAAGSDAPRFGRLAEECIQLRPDIIVAATTPAALAASARRRRSRS
jgi:putative ABC transport system substrate-binding protein